MSEDPAYSRAVSLHLSRTLDEIGVNTLTVSRRRQTFLCDEKVNSICKQLIGFNNSNFHFGSQTEGATTPGLNSDLDTLTCYYDVNVIENWSEWKQGKVNLLMLQENTAPGYCRLQVLSPDIPMARKFLPNEECAYDERGRVLMTNSMLHEPLQGVKLVKNGPAISQCNTPGIVDNDYVDAYLCKSWPAQAKEFTSRQRRYGWPSPRLLQLSVQRGVFLVPVGYKLSPTEPLEWRISASYAERCLMFSLTIVQIKCYVVLKMLVKTFIEPRIKKCISSYHCKTALLYCTENSAAGFWREDNLLQCVQGCLEMLLSWVTDGFCPHFIMPQENLFGGKVTVRNKKLLESVLSNLMKSKGRVLLRVCIDDLGHKLQAKLSTEPSPIPVLDSLATVRLVGQFEFCVHSHRNSAITLILDTNTVTDTVAAARSVYQKIQMIRDRIRQADKLERQAIQAYIEALSCWLGSLLASIALSRKVRVPKAAIRLIRVGAKHDISTTLKLASIFYCSGELRKVETILQNLEDLFFGNEIQTICECYSNGYYMTDELCHMMFVLKGRRQRATLFASCVTFTAQEIHCAPPAIRNELFRADGDDASCSEHIFVAWMNRATIDSQPYLYYLLFITYKQLRKRDLLQRALSNLERCIREANKCHHIETAWNLLGQCKEMEQEPEAAMACYRKSLEIRPRSNAANRHVQNLRYTSIRNGF